MPWVDLEAARKKVREQSKVALADELGLPQGWLVTQKGPAREYTSPDGTLYKSLKQLGESNVLESDVFRKLQRNDFQSKSADLSDATEYGFPEGWKCKVYARAKNFFSPDGDQYTSLLAATKAAKAWMAMRGEGTSTSHEAEQEEMLVKTGSVRKRGSKILWGLPARKLRYSEQDGGTDASESSHADKKSQSSIEEISAFGSNSPAESTDTRLFEPGDGFMIQEASEGNEWIIVPDDVLCIDLLTIGRNIEAAGWTLKSESSPRVFHNSFDGSLLTLSTCGKLVVESCTQQSAYSIATIFVNDWLVNT